jgi:quinol monooxygenase YgiN
MIVIQGFLRTEPENVAGLKQAALPLIAASRQETGNIAYAFAEDIAEPGLVHFIERWADDAALAAHNSTPHLAAFLGALPSLGIIAFRTARYDAAGETLLAGA